MRLGGSAIGAAALGVMAGGCGGDSGDNRSATQNAASPSTSPTTGQRSFTHGKQITKSNIGLSDPDALERSDSIDTTDGQVIENQEIHGRVEVGAGHHVVLRNCRVIGPPELSSSSYALGCTQEGGLLVEIENCEFVTRSEVTNTLTLWGDANISIRRSIFRGGETGAYFNPQRDPGLIDSGDPGVPNARVLLEECWFGDLLTHPESHIDCIQIDGGGYIVLRRIKSMAFHLRPGADPLETEANIHDMASAAAILTQNSSNPDQISNVAVRDSYFDGGNYCVDTKAGDGKNPKRIYVTGCRWGIHHRFAPFRYGSGTTHHNNAWGASGITECCGRVETGAPLVPGD